MQRSTLRLLSGKSIAGWPSDASIDSEDAVAFSALMGVCRRIEKFPLENAGGTARAASSEQCHTGLADARKNARCGHPPGGIVDTRSSLLRGGTKGRFRRELREVLVDAPLAGGVAVSVRLTPYSSHSTQSSGISKR